jgi:integrase
MWTPRELRHSFVSVLSDAGVPLEETSQLVGHSGTTVTELVHPAHGGVQMRREAAWGFDDSVHRSL